MPSFKLHTVFEVVRGLKLFVDLEAGLTRRENPGLESRTDVSKTLDPSGRIAPDRIIWLFGSARTGSTWLSQMMGRLAGHKVWLEPHVGELFGRLYYEWSEERHFQTEHFILGAHKTLWIDLVRHFVLQAAARRFPEMAKSGYLVIKEPNGSVGAPLLMETLPESRMIFLVRDPRDAVASALDAAREGGWNYASTSKSKRDRSPTLGGDPDEIVRTRAVRYLQNVRSSKQAYEAHKGRKVLVKYEDLRANTLDVMKRIYSALGIAVDEENLARAVEKHSWQNIPEEKKGAGKTHRKATPGSWREDLTPKQVKVVERITAPLLEEFYPA